MVASFPGSPLAPAREEPGNEARHTDFLRARRLNLFLQCIFTDVENSKLTSGVLNHGSAVVLVCLKLCSLAPSNSLEPRPGSGE